MKTVKIIDLFAGMGGIKLGFMKAFVALGFNVKCVLTSEIKESAIECLKHNFDNIEVKGDIKEIHSQDIPDFDFLLAGFPCQSFSAAGNRDGFSDTRGTLFFEIERILKEKNPYGFLLENVDTLVTHDRENKNDETGKTLNIILTSLENLGYKVTWKILDSKDYGVAQSRKRIYIVGTKNHYFNFEKIKKEKPIYFSKIQEHGLKVSNTKFTKKLLEHFQPQDLYGKSIKDKRGGKNNIHSWNFELKGKISMEQQELIEKLFRERRKKHWAQEIGIKWMDGMPLTLNQISTFFPHENLEELLVDLVKKKYLTLEHPKQEIKIKNKDGNLVPRRVKDETKEIGYNIVAGKLSFEFSKILDIDGVVPTLVATDVEKLGVIDGKGIRSLSLREGLRLCGYPESYSLNIFNENNKTEKRKALDLLGNTVVVTVIEKIAHELGKMYLLKSTNSLSSKKEKLKLEQNSLF